MSKKIEYRCDVCLDIINETDTDLIATLSGNIHPDRISRKLEHICYSCAESIVDHIESLAASKVAKPIEETDGAKICRVNGKTYRLVSVSLPAGFDSNYACERCAASKVPGLCPLLDDCSETSDTTASFWVEVK